MEAWLAELDEKKKSAVTLNDEQERMKASMKVRVYRVPPRLVMNTASAQSLT